MRIQTTRKELEYLASIGIPSDVIFQRHPSGKKTTSLKVSTSAVPPVLKVSNTLKPLQKKSKDPSWFWALCEWIKKIFAILIMLLSIPVGSCQTSQQKNMKNIHATPKTKSFQHSYHFDFTGIWDELSWLIPNTPDILNEIFFSWESDYEVFYDAVFEKLQDEYWQVPMMEKSHLPAIKVTLLSIVIPEEGEKAVLQKSVIALRDKNQFLSFAIDNREKRQSLITPMIDRFITIIVIVILLMLLVILVMIMRQTQSKVLSQKTSPNKTIEQITPVSHRSSNQTHQIHKQVNMKIKPKTPIGTWNVALSSITGNTRKENQDHGIAFEIEGNQVLIAADGCGGLPYGKEAANIAVNTAVHSLTNSCNANKSETAQIPEALACKALENAAKQLVLKGKKLNITDIKGGLRTTLIVVVVTNKEIGYCYIGDGGGYILRQSGEIIKFLEPQKGAAANILAASLGPVMEGQPCSGTLPRFPGDFLVMGSDGVFDYVGNNFIPNVLRMAIECKGDLQKVVDQVLNELVNAQDDKGYLCDDNLTFGIMGTKNPPKLAKGFWKNIDQFKNLASSIKE